MIRRIIGGVVLGAIASAVIYEILERSNPELLEKVKDWFSEEADDFIEPEEAVESN